MSANHVTRLPVVDIDATIKGRLAAYLAEHAERVEDIAQSGPDAIDSAEPEHGLFRLLCAQLMAQREPDNGFHYLTLANAFWSLGHADEALKTYQVLDTMRYPFLGYYDDPQFNIAIIEADRGNFHTAIHSFETCRQRYPASAAEISFYLGSVHHEMMNLSAAVTFYEKCITGLKQRRGHDNDDEIEYVNACMNDARSGRRFAGKRKSPWLEFIH